jgi:hypothetical protein
MKMFSEQQRAAGGLQPQSSIVFGTVVATDEEGRRLKIVVEPWGVETGWCKVLKDTFYPIPPLEIHAPHPDPDAPIDPETGQNLHKHNNHSPHEPEWPYKVDQEVLAAVVQGNNGAEQYVVLGLIDMGAVSDQ